MSIVVNGKVVAGVGQQGEQGIPGKSAYQIAQENGYSGSEQEFNQILGALADTATLDEINGKIGNSSDGSDVSSLFGKIAGLNSQSGNGIVKSVQRGTVTFSSVNQKTVTISSVNPEKCIVLLNSSVSGSYHSLGSKSYKHTRGQTSIVNSLSSNSLVISSSFQEYYSTITQDLETFFGTASWEIVEFY